MPTSLTSNEVNRLNYTFTYVKQFELCAPGDNVYNYFGFSDQVHYRLMNLWSARYDMVSEDMTRENFSLYISQGLPFGGSVNKRKADKIFINHAIDQIKTQESQRRNNLFFGFGLKTSKDRLIVLSKILQKLYQLENESLPSTDLLALINLCNTLAIDKNEKYQSRQKNNFKSLLRTIRDDLLMSLGDMTALELRKTYAQVAKEIFDFVDMANEALKFKFGMSIPEFNDSWQQLKSSFQVEIEGGNEIVTTRIAAVNEALNNMIVSLKNEKSIASSIYRDFPHLSAWDVSLRMKDKEQIRVWDQLKSTMKKAKEPTSHEAISKRLDGYIYSLNSTIDQLQGYVNIINAMPKTKIPQSIEDRMEPIKEVISDKKIHQDFPDVFTANPWLEPANPNNPFFQVFQDQSSMDLSYKGNKVEILNYTE